MVVIVAVTGLVGYLVALPVLLWHRHDLHSFHRPLWVGYGSRQARLQGALVCYLAFGWPELFMALGWRTSTVRGALVTERDNFRDDRESRHGDSDDGSS